MNKRLGTEGLDMAGVTSAASKKGLTIQDLMAMPEQDGWVYKGETPRDGRSWVCSCYVAAFYKVAGIFGTSDI